MSENLFYKEEKELYHFLNAHTSTPTYIDMLAKSSDHVKVAIVHSFGHLGKDALVSLIFQKG